MAYQLIENFAAGLDTRKSPLTAPSGTLTRLVNAVITPGGEIQKRRAFVQIATLTGSTGLAATAAGLYIFGKNVVPPIPSISVPGVTLKGLKVPNANFVQTDFDVFNGLIYVSGYEPGTYRHYFQDADTTMAETEGTGKGPYIRTFKSKVYSVRGSYLHFCKTGDPMKWVPESTTPANIGAGNINLAMHDADSEVLTSLEVYYDKLAVFSNEATQIWSMDSDQSKNQFEQLLRGVGTNAPRSPLQYGNGDVLFLDESGLRSLKAKDASNSASVSDIGSPVDPTLVALRKIHGAGYMNNSVSLLEPSVGRYWMVITTQIFVLSYFPGPKVTAWSVFTLPELGAATVTNAVTCGSYIFLRDSLDRLWIYGGTDGLAYNNCGVEVRLPYLDGKKPGHKKLFQAFDATVSFDYEPDNPTGTWRVAVSYDPTNPDVEETIATIDKPTWNIGAHELQGYDSHFSLRFYNDDDLSVTLSNCAVHYEMADSEA